MVKRSGTDPRVPVRTLSRRDNRDSQYNDRKHFAVMRTNDSIGNRKTHTEGDRTPPGVNYKNTNAVNQYEEITWPGPVNEALGYDADGDMTGSGLVADDFDHDGDVDLGDFGFFQGCFNGPNRPPRQAGCEQADADDDGDVDLADQAVFQGCFNGPNRPPNCLGSLKPMRYAWDAENRLVEAAPIFPQCSGDPEVCDRKVTFEYDYMNRRVRKQVFAWNGTSWNTTPAEDWRFVYDGWNVVEVLNASGEPQQKYTWGLDLSGLAGATEPRAPASGPGIHGAGGIGGLLAREEPQAVGDPKRHWYLYDANGNVGQLLKYVAGPPPTVTLAAHYEYDPYGNTIRKDDVDQSGVVDANPFRFSTKWFDPETAHYAYIFRILDLRLGRWLSRDPIEERGGLVLYTFVANRPTTLYDALGREAMWCESLGCVDISDIVYDSGFGGASFGTVSGFVDCSGQWAGIQQSIRNAVSTACRVMHEAHACLAGDFENIPRPAAPAWEQVYWDVVRQTRDQLLEILQVALHEGCRDGVDVECECSCEPGKDAYTRGCVWGSWANLHLCPSQLKAGPSELQSIVLHELTHYGCSTDKASDLINAHNLEKYVPWLAGWCKKVAGRNPPVSP